MLSLGVLPVGVDCGSRVLVRVHVHVHVVKDHGLRIMDQGSKDHGLRIKHRGSWINDQGSRIKDQGSRIQDQGPRIKDLGPCFGTNEHPRRDTDVILRLSKSTVEDLSF